MYDFITDLFNLDKNMIKVVHIVSLPDVTQLHLSLIHISSAAENLSGGGRFPCISE